MLTTLLLAIPSPGKPAPVLSDAKPLSGNPQNVVEASAVLGDISVLWDATHQTITVDTISAKLPETLKIHAPFAVARVLLRGNEVTFTRQKGVVILSNWPDYLSK